jgi:hypothetical protein
MNSRPNIGDQLDRQNREFSTLRTLASHYNRLMNVPIVDDDYPEARHKYETAMRDFLDAIRANGRI